ncbi:MAG: PHP domain-containing protein [Halobacteriota archaeon]
MDCESVVADLHVHTTASDGVLSVAELPAAAREAGISAVAVTDHDRLNADLDGPVTTVEDLAVIRGIEMQVDAGAQSVDLLGYGVRETESLRAELDRLQRNRIERGRAIVERVEDRLGVDLDVDISEGLGRPDVARAIDASDADYDFQGAFDHLIGDDGPCYVARDIPDAEAGIDLLSEACSLVGLAHPFRYEDTDAALALAPELDAIERCYPYGREVDFEPLDRLVDEYGLVVTGGSDTHGPTVGDVGVSETTYERFRTRL